MRARDVMSQDIQTIAATATIAEAARILINAQINAMPVEDANGALVGVVSEADLIRALQAAGASALEQGVAGNLAASLAVHVSQRRLVQEVMTRNVITADANSDLASVAALMLEHRLKRLPVLRGKEIVGVIRRSDLLKALLSTVEAGQAVRSSADFETPEDDQLRRRVEGALAEGVSAPWRPEVVALNGAVHLWGRAASHDLLERYQATTAGVPGVRSVTMHMHVAPVGGARR